MLRHSDLANQWLELTSTQTKGEDNLDVTMEVCIVISHAIVLVSQLCTELLQINVASNFLSQFKVS